jgi:hypothetical protein
LLVSFRLYFVIAEDSLCISTMYYLLLWIYVVLIVKKKWFFLFQKKSDSFADSSGHIECL